MNKIIVTHINPDLDAAMSSWLIKRFLPGWKQAEIAFVPAGQTLNQVDPDADSNLIHVDTGMGRFDHHQTAERTCASRRVYEYLLGNNKLKAPFDKILERMTEFAISIDHFEEFFYPEPLSDRYDFLLPSVIDGMRGPFGGDDNKMIEISHLCLDAVLQNFRNKVRAEEEIVSSGYIFESAWGKTLVIESSNEEVVKIAQKQGYNLVARKDPKKGFLRIKAAPLAENNIANLKKDFETADPQATWFLHSSGRMLLNGSSKNPASVSTRLEFKKIIEIIKHAQS